MAIDLSLNEEQLHLQSSAREFFRQHCSPATVRELEAGELGYSPEMWHDMAELGWLGITYPESYGGSGGRFLDLYPIYEEMGRFLVPSPHLDTVAVAGETVSRVGSAEQKEELLPAIARGDCIISLALLEPEGSFGPSGISCSATREWGNYRLTGTKLLVGYASSADHFLVVARTGGMRTADGISLFLVDARAEGVSWTPMQNVAGCPLYTVRFDGVLTPTDRLLGELGQGWPPLSTSMTEAAVLQTATIVGAAESVFEMTNRYAKERSQFGNPIGRYQAVQYLVTDILIDFHRTDLLARQAAFRIDSGRLYEREAAMAISFGKKATAHLNRQAHEVHAGIAFMHEHDLTLFSRRAKFWENNLGDAQYHIERLAKAIGI